MYSEKITCPNCELQPHNFTSSTVIPLSSFTPPNKVVPCVGGPCKVKAALGYESFEDPSQPEDNTHPRRGKGKDR